MKTLPLLILTILCSGCAGACRGSDDGPAAAQATGAAPGAAPATASDSAAASSAATPLPDGPWRDLARKLVEAKSLEAATSVTREVLARGGIATFDGQRVLVEAAAPAAFRATPLETVHLAMEARHRATASRMTVAEFAQMLETFGWPFPGGSEGGGTADATPRGRPSDPERARANEQKARDAAGEADRAKDAAMAATIEAEQKAGRARVDAAQQRVIEATAAWQRARQAIGKAPAGEKAAAEAQVQAALAARMATIQELGVVRNAEDQAGDERRTRQSRVRQDQYRIERIQRSIGPDYRAGEQLMEMLGAWVRAAAADPSNPRSFTPLFLAEMARRQDPPVDLLGSRFTRPGRREGTPVDLRGGPRSGQLRLTLLEIELFAAAFGRGGAAAASLHDDMRRTAGPDVALASFIPVVQDPCGAIKDIMKTIGEAIGGKTGGEIGSGLGGVGTSIAFGKELEKIVEAATDSGTADAFGKAMSAVGIAAKIAKLSAFYSQQRISVTATPLSIHKPVGHNEYVGYIATAGVSDEDWAEYDRMAGKEGAQIDRATRDCLETLGVPTFANASDLAKEAENWLVEWHLVEGSPQHAYWSIDTNSFYLPGRQAMKLQRSGATSASATFVVDILPEEKHSGKTVRAYVTARASLDAAGMPGLGTLINTITIIGLVDSLVELGTGWFQFMNMPKAYGTVEVEYHCPKPTTVYPTEKPVGDGGGGDGPSDCTIAAEKRK